MDQQAAKRLIENTFSQPFDEGRFRHFVINLLNNVDEGKAFNWTAGAYIKDSFKDHIKKYRRLGTYTDPNGQKIDVLVSHLRNQWALDRSRATQRNFVATYLKKRGEKEAALIAYYTDDPEDWRFSFIRMEYREEVTPAGKVRVKEEFTPARRYSFLVGKNEPSHTAQQQIVPILQDDRNNPTISGLEQAFSVEAVTKRFYTDYRGLFEKLTAEIERLVEQDERVREEFESKTIEVANFAKKLLGQIVFLYFLQKKGWLGVGKDEQGNLKPWGTGPKNFLRRLFEKEFIDYGNFFDDVLEPLFYEALATERPDDYYSRFNCKIPFLNGGLFEAIHDYNWREIDILLPNDLFQQIFDTFDLYNFTVREDEPLEKEVAVDPEMLGKVFENLLPENLRKGKGTYYTPRPIVHYMCQESLINYLDSAINTGGVPLVSLSQERLFKGSEPEQMPLEKMGHKIVVLLKDIEEFIRKSEFAVEHDVAKEAGTKTYKYQVPESIRAHAKLLDDTLAGIKICDPAVGSGAFPVGMMHEIVKARNVLSTYLENEEDRDTYTLKRHCIQESLYGVDIDPGAIDIAKLRLWLSLIVDEEDYETINPLPNLDYKIMQGNSLIEDFHGISLDHTGEETGDLLGKDHEMERLIKDLHEKQNAFFNATHPGEKRRLKDAVEEAVLAVFHYRLEQVNKPYYDSLKRIEQTVQTIPEGAREQYRKEEKEKLIKHFDFDPEAVENELREMTHGNKLRSFFPWRLYFADVFQKKSGFDVVIANPPYVRMEEIKELKAYFRRSFPQVYEGRADLFVYFYCVGLNILHRDGVLTFISSNKFMRARYGEGLRNLLTNSTALVTVIDFGDLPVFEATTYPSVLVMRKRRPAKNHTLQALTVDDIAAVDHLPEVVQAQSWPQPQRSLRREGWALERPEVLALLEKLRCSGTPLGEYVEGKFYRGVVTGLNKAFVIDRSTRDRLIAEDPRSTEIIKPWLRGRDVKRWRVDWAELYVIFTRHGVEIGHYPAIQTYLELFREQLEQRATSAHHAWYELQQPQMGIYPEFEKPKIVYPDIAKQCEFAFDDQNLFPDCTLFIVPDVDLYLVGILNSTVVEWFYRHVSPTIQQDFLRFKRIYLKQIPIPDVIPTHHAAIEALVRKLLDAEGQGPQVSEWEQELNALVYELYGLTNEEIHIVEEATK